ncbi:MAG: hypothetical protein UR66_C0002G0121 [Candidatus Moranbacteria bacterium GW2011_GWE1_35_17]|nr:MAG: hypothetical protein UR66_C0002G0121 [Candidatus Moranbacteria bacterium GW2011_GWE1_35_17]
MSIENKKNPQFEDFLWRTLSHAPSAIAFSDVLPNVCFCENKISLSHIHGGLASRRSRASARRRSPSLKLWRTKSGERGIRTPGTRKGSEIRTHGELSSTTVFKTVPLNHSGTLPLFCGASCRFRPLSHLSIIKFLALSQYSSLK